MHVASPHQSQQLQGTLRVAVRFSGQFFRKTVVSVRVAEFDIFKGDRGVAGTGIACRPQPVQVNVRLRASCTRAVV